MAPFVKKQDKHLQSQFEHIIKNNGYVEFHMKGKLSMIYVNLKIHFIKVYLIIHR